MTEQHFERIEPGAGTGLVAVIGEIALFVADSEGAGRLVDVTREAAASDSPPGRALARRLAAHLTGDEADSVPDFGVVAADDDGWILLLHGDVAASFVTADGTEEHLSGADSVTWLDRALAAGVGPVLIAPAGLAAPDAGPASLEAGVVPGGWLRAVPASSADAAAPASEASATATPAPETAVTVSTVSSVTETTVTEATVTEATVTEAIVAGAVVTAATVTAATVTPGIGSDAKATVPPPLQDGDATSEMSITGGPAIDDAVTGATATAERQFPDGEVELFSLAPDGVEQRDALPIDGTTAPGGAADTGDADTEDELPRPTGVSRSNATVAVVKPGGAQSGQQEVGASKQPSLGILVFDNGSTYGLDGDYVVGREPDDEPNILQGRARPIVLDDPDGTVSRVHAEIRLVGGEVQLIDRGSTNGTYCWDAANSVWNQLTAGEAQVIQPGERGAFGRLTFVYERPAAPEPDATAAPDTSAATRGAATMAVRNVIGVLTTDDGAMHPLDRSYVIGRNPMDDESVRQALASAIVLRDDPQVSPVHARVSIEAGTVLVSDAGTSTGTFVAEPGASSWDPVGLDPVELKPGWSMRVGHCVLTFRSATS